MNNNSTRIQLVFPMNASGVWFNFSRASSHDEELFVFLSILSILLIVCGVFFGVFILAIVRFSKLLTVSAVLIGNLCLCTLLYSSLVLPVHIMTLLARQSIVGDNGFICQTVSFLHVTINMASANTHVAIAVHRFCIFRCSVKCMFIRSKRFAFVLALLAWFPSVLTNVFPLFGLGARHGFDKRLYRCTFGPPAERSYALFSRLMLGVVPLMTMIGFYFAIFWIRKRSRRKLTVVAAIPRQPAQLRSIRRDYQATRICGIACLGFLIFYLPNALYGLLGYFKIVSSASGSLVCNQLQIIGLCTNPLLYAVFSRDLRLTMFTCSRRCCWPGMDKVDMSVTAGSANGNQPSDSPSALAKFRGAAGSTVPAT